MKVFEQTGKDNDHLVSVVVSTDVAAALYLISQPEDRKSVGVQENHVHLTGILYIKEPCALV